MPTTAKAEPLTVHRNLWGNKTCYLDKDGKQVDIELLQEARDYANAHRSRYNGIRVEYQSAPQEEIVRGRSLTEIGEAEE